VRLCPNFLCNSNQIIVCMHRSAEEFPTEVRTTAMGIVAAAGRIGAAVAMFVNGTLESNVAVLLFVTSGCMMVGGLASGYLRNDATKHALSDHV
jgi:nitrate/nitrite transporter NarK